MADSPQQLAACLDSLRMLCRSYAYGGLHEGRFAKVEVLLADDSIETDSITLNREKLRNLDRQGIDTHYFGIDEQQVLLQRVHAQELDSIVGVHQEQAFAHKGQAMMRNIVYLKLAKMRARMPGERLLFYTIDADQRFQVRVSTPGVPVRPRITTWPTGSVSGRVKRSIVIAASLRERRIMASVLPSSAHAWAVSFMASIRRA